MVELAGVKTGDFVVPGDKLGVIEEFSPGRNVYEEGGVIYAAVPGVVLKNLADRVISVYPFVEKPVLPCRNDEVVGVVTEIKGKVVFLKLVAKVKPQKTVFGRPFLGAIYIANIMRGFVKDISKLFKPGDLVKAKVVSANKFPIQLTTVGPNYGVVFARCPRCRLPLDLSKEGLVCHNCGLVDRERKVARDYRRIRFL
mgnify:CR=1 FL=1